MSKLIKIGDTPFMVSLDVISSSLQNILLDEIKHKCSVNELILEDNKLIYVNHRKNNIIVSDNKTIVNLYKAITYLDDYNDKDVSTIKEDTKENGYEYVDLGLPSGTLWATCNVGANSPTEYGKYFAWGDAVGYYDNEVHDFSWNIYKYGDGSDFTKYNVTDGKVILDSEDDAVHVNMGGDWHMPTSAQLKELINETNHEWINNYQGSGINGMLFTSKTDSTKSIFIPASGYRWGTSVYCQGNNANLWSSSLLTGYLNDSWGLYFDSGDCGMGDGSRYNGFCLRGVIKKNNI